MKESSIDKIAKRLNLTKGETEELLDDIKREVGGGLGKRALMAGAGGALLGAFGTGVMADPASADPRIHFKDGDITGVDDFGAQKLLRV